MIPSIENNYVRIPETQWDAVLDVAVNDSVGDEEKYQALRSIFAKHDIPINGYFETGPDMRWSFVDAATTYWSEPLLRIIVERAPNKATEGLDILAESVWSDKAVEILFGRGYALAGAGDPQAQTLLQQCANYGTPGAIARLAEKGLDLDGLVKSGDVVVPAIIHAARTGRSEVLEGFLRAGANPEIAGYDGRTFLHAAVRLDETKSKAWVDSDDNVDRLRRILALANELAIDVDLRDGAGQSPLHLAARYGYNNKAVALLEHGANVTLCDHDQKTPLVLAQECGHDEVASVILSWKAHQAVLQAVRTAAPGAAAQAR